MKQQESHTILRTIKNHRIYIMSILIINFNSERQK